MKENHKHRAIELGKDILILLLTCSALWLAAKTQLLGPLSNLLREDRYPDIKYGVKLGYKNIGFNGKFYTFPYFLAFLLRRFLSDRKIVFK